MKSKCRFSPKFETAGITKATLGFTACHFFLPEELRTAFELPYVEILEMAGLEGISTHHSRHLNLLAKNPERWKIWLETHLQTCTHPSVVGISEHMLIVCRKHLSRQP